MIASIVLVVVLIVGLVSPLVLYVFVRKEHGSRETMDRNRAEEAARRDTDTRK